jgi:hypothetical protein
VQRVRGNAFYDYSKVYSKDKLRTLDLKSTGMELFFDTKWWNMLPISFGIRYSYLIDHKKVGWEPHQFEFVLPVDLIPD